MPAHDSIGPALIASLPQLRRYALAVCRDSDLADELVQETCERALVSGLPDGDTPFNAWLFTIARNRWFDRLRQRKARGEHESVDDHADLADPYAHDEAMQARHTLVKVEQAMQKLPPEQQELMHLVCVEELSYKEAAAVVGVPIGTVMSRLARARVRLAELAGLLPATASNA
jgi:RNA polymerase sigma-70 factor (ECF subfamily)